jgi:hypothetical protein
MNIERVLAILRGTFIVAWVVTVASIVGTGYIETTAIQQPSVADGVYIYPWTVKGTLHFLTATQASLIGSFYHFLLGAFPTGIVSGFIYGVLRAVTERRHKR